MILRFLMGIPFLITGCVAGNQEQDTFGPYAAYYNTPADHRLKTLKAKVDSLDAPLLSAYAIDSSWNFMLGDGSERLHASVKQVKGVYVNLPHRLEKPDMAFWYSREIEIDEKGVLSIHADDGAQLFIGDKQVNRLHGIHFPVDTTGRLLLTVRVLNNAMAGGLRHVSYSTQKQYEQYRAQRALVQRLKIVVEKIVLLNQSTDEMIEKVSYAVDERNEPALGAAEKALADVPFFSGPWLLRNCATQWSVNVISENDQPINIHYGTQELQFKNELSQHGRMASFKLYDLLPDKKYYYRITSGKTISPVYSFKTTSPTSYFSFSVWADSQSGWKNFQQNINNTLPHNDAFGIGVGDLVADGSDAEQWRMFFNTLSASSASRPFYLIAGNHDYDGYYDDLEAALYKKYLRGASKTYVSWTHGNCAFIALDPNENFPIGIHTGTEKHRWFLEQLASSEWNKATWRFVLLHQPPYSQGWAGYQGDRVIRELLEPLVEKAKIDFVISGHTHDYERLTRTYGIQRTTYLIVGGGGGSLEPAASSAVPEMDTVLKVHHTGRFHVNGNTILFEAIDLHNNIIDSFERSR